MNYIALLVCLLISLAITPLVKRFAIWVGAVDQPNYRKIHSRVMPRLGGLAIFISFMVGFVIFDPVSEYYWPILIGALLITATGILDDLFELSAKIKFSVQLIAAGIVVFNDVQINFINLPFGETLDFGYFSIPITILWIVGITNAINLIDGLDGLAAGVSSIALITISGLAISLGDTFVALMGLMLLGSTVGFLFYNFHPAKIFMGDTGALFLGYMIGVFSVLGFKNVTLFSLIVPIIILGVPILDTFFAIVRRFIQHKPLSSPDKLHLHHCLLKLGFGHRQTVILIYAMSGLFSIAAIIFTKSTVWGSTITLISLAILVEIVVEMTGLISENYRPILRIIEGSRSKKY
ncbi:glycosyltransferase family 4 protein [Sediminibacillus massiliensis]|uniref:glycosyltransferase family 4 protein n=1 Tax=Sediminibacillus massiliensis TaxID=1926277 RepID=UPI0009885450|nr:MraY family glycosyltransferase [Sediminibacillus massiliensis]